MFNVNETHFQTEIKNHTNEKDTVTATEQYQYNLTKYSKHSWFKVSLKLENALSDQRRLG